MIFRSVPGLTVLAILFFGLAARAADVKEIHVKNKGLGVSDSESVLAYTSIKVGEEFTRNAVNRDIKALQKTGRFASVSAEVETVPGGVAVTYVVESKPKIRWIFIEGADYLGNKKVRELLELGVGDSVDDATLAVKAQKVIDSYHKKYFPDAMLTWNIEPSAEAGQVNVRINVHEGKRANVKSITFVGNDHVPARELRKVMKQRQINWLSWITDAGTYSPDDLQTDQETLKKAFMDRGYLDADVREPVVTQRRPKSLQVLIGVQEGKQYRLGTIRIAGVTLFPLNDVEEIVKIHPHDIASLEAIEKVAGEIRDYYGSRGRIKSSVDYDLDLHRDTCVADVRFKVTEGKLAYIRNIIIRGNSQTKDKVIRRELAVYPGEIYNEVKVRTSEKRLKNLGYFSYVNSSPESTPEPDKYDLAFDVEEQKTGQFTVGAGFSSIDQLVVFAELSQGNFDIADWPRFTGGGQKLKLSAQVGTARKDYEISFIEPWFLNRRLSLGVDLFEHDSSYYSTEYVQKDIGGNISIGKPLSAYNRINFIYGLEQFDIYDISTNASEFIQREAGTRLKSSFTIELVHDTRDSVFLPTRGNRSSASVQLAGGPLGGDTDIYSVQGRSSEFWPLWFDHVFNLRGSAAVVQNYGNTDWVPIFDREFLGGARTVRGFKYRDVGPKDNVNDEPVGGESEIYGTAEYTMPVAEKVRFAVFYDAGIVWMDVFKKGDDTGISTGDGSLNSSAGIGLRFDFQAFPIQLDYSWPIQTDSENARPSGRFSFWLGYTY